MRRMAVAVAGEATAFDEADDEHAPLLVEEAVHVSLESAQIGDGFFFPIASVTISP